MECPRCRKVRNERVHMKDVKRKGGFHKHTKYICPECGLVRMKRNRKKKRRR
ncbi:MAG: hypothetical protein U9O98_07880 [Asgard group archaeon]|nr:hypothetical protein [Asgard group archaeon]